MHQGYSGGMPPWDLHREVGVLQNQVQNIERRQSEHIASTGAWLEDLDDRTVNLERKQAADELRDSMRLKFAGFLVSGPFWRVVYGAAAGLLALTAYMRLPS